MNVIRCSDNLRLFYNRGFSVANCKLISYDIDSDIMHFRITFSKLTGGYKDKNLRTYKTSNGYYVLLFGKRYYLDFDKWSAWYLVY